MDADAQPSRKRRPLRRLLIAVGTVIAILAVVASGAWIWKPSIERMKPVQCDLFAEMDA